jgi:hypothetical protein
MRPPPPAAPPFLLFGFILLPMLVAAVAVLGTAKALWDRKSTHWLEWVAAAAPIGAMGMSWTLAVDGLIARFELRPPPLFALTLACVALWVGLAASKVGDAVSQLPLHALVGFHAFRFPLELLMHAAARADVMPPQMSFSGWNFDIISGVTALGMARLVALGRAPRALLLAWNALGSVLLLTIIVIAIASAPPFLAFGTDRLHANTWVAFAPFVWLPTVLVAAACAGHVVLWRRLLRPVPPLAKV